MRGTVEFLDVHIQTPEFAMLLRGLNATERMIVTLYYAEGETMNAIGQATGLSESRVSQLHSSIIARLKARLTRVIR